MKKMWIITLLLLSALCVEAQSIRLTRYDAPNALYLDLDRLYNFNMYERSRIELGLAWVSPSETAAQMRGESPTVSKKGWGQWMLRPYVAYGTGDHEWKYGIGTMLRLPGPHGLRLVAWAYNDLERAASRRLNSYRMLLPSMNDGIVASRFVGVKGGSMDFCFRLRYGWEVQLGALQTWEDYRFDFAGQFYPKEQPARQAETRVFTELRSRIEWQKALTLSLRAGRVGSPAGTSAGGERASHYYWQALTQYDADIKETGLHLFGQLGFASEEAPYSRMLDLSGTAYSMYFFKNAFLTVRPNRFTANMFAHVCLNYTAPLPLWELSWSSPHPFLQVNAMWGRLLGQDVNGQRVWDGLTLQAPNKGLLEPATGFDRLVHWGLMDIGFAVAYQLCPTTASYKYDKIEDNMAFTIVADFILDRYK